jgi:hypothetical protein
MISVLQPSGRATRRSCQDRPADSLPNRDAVRPRTRETVMVTGRAHCATGVGETVELPSVRRLARSAPTPSVAHIGEVRGVRWK